MTTELLGRYQIEFDTGKEWESCAAADSYDVAKVIVSALHDKYEDSCMGFRIIDAKEGKLITDWVNGSFVNETAPLMN